MTAQREHLGRYTLEDVLGRGGMAVVYRGRDEELGRPVAVKILADNLAGDEAFRERFLREARLAARVAHPNIVDVYDWGEGDDGRPYIVMEYVDGETAGELLARRGKLEPDEAVELAVQVCGGLEHAHAAGLVHRDIKPQNLLLRPDGTLKIVDFGIARAEHGTRLTEVGSVLGTAAYLAPEQAAGGEITPAADIYALGVVLYELLTGRTPYTYETLTQLLVAQQDQQIIPLRQLEPRVPPRLEEIVMRCLARLPDYRPPSASSLADQLRTLSEPVPTVQRAGASDEAPTEQAAPPTAVTVPHYPHRPRRPARVRAWWLAAAAATALVVFVVSFAALRGDGDGRTPPVRPTSPTAASPAAQARELSAWLRTHSR